MTWITISTLFKIEQIYDRKLFIAFATQQRYMKIAQDLKHDWAKISADVKPHRTAADVERAKKRQERVYNDDPF